jgi:hypothetical protein
VTRPLSIRSQPGRRNWPPLTTVLAAITCSVNTTPTLALATASGVPTQKMSAALFR